MHVVSSYKFDILQFSNTAYEMTAHDASIFTRYYHSKGTTTDLELNSLSKKSILAERVASFTSHSVHRSFLHLSLDSFEQHKQWLASFLLQHIQMFLMNFTTTDF